VGRQKTIYVKDADLPVWGRFEKAVKVGAAAGSVSALIAEAMHQYLAQFGDQGGGLSVKAPDDDPAVTFGPDVTAILLRGATGTWALWLDQDTYSGADSPQEMGGGTLAEAVAAGRARMTTALGPRELEKAAARLRRALGLENDLTSTDGRATGRQWALQRATPGELEAISELAHSSWVSIGPAGEAAADVWPTLMTEVARHGLPTQAEGGLAEIARDDFMVGFVEEASDVYDQILKTERHAAPDARPTA
jgi:hypothetical protein